MFTPMRNIIMVKRYLLVLIKMTKGVATSKL